MIQNRREVKEIPRVMRKEQTGYKLCTRPREKPVQIRTGRQRFPEEYLKKKEKVLKMDLMDNLKCLP